MITEVLERAGNRLLRLDPDSVKRLSPLQGKVFKMDIGVIDKAIFIVPGEEGLQVRKNWPGDVDITLRGSPLAFLQFGLGGKKRDNRVFMDKKLSIEGDVELAQDFQKILNDMDIDLEELFSHYVGDVAAHQIGRGARRFRRWIGETAESFRLDVGEYMVEEIRILAPYWRVDDFIEMTDILRADVDRLEQRVKRLRERIE